MIIKEGFDKIKTCGNYNPILNRSILVSCFLNDNLSKSLWEYNFYSQEDKLTYTFIVDNDEVILKDTGSLMNLKQTPEELKINIGFVSNLLIELQERKMIECLSPNEKRNRFYKVTKEGKKIKQLIKKQLFK